MACELFPAYRSNLRLIFGFVFVSLEAVRRVLLAFAVVCAAVEVLKHGGLVSLLSWLVPANVLYQHWCFFFGGQGEGIEADSSIFVRNASMFNLVKISRTVFRSDFIFAPLPKEYGSVHLRPPPYTGMYAVTNQPCGGR